MSRRAHLRQGSRIQHRHALSTSCIHKLLEVTKITPEASSATGVANSAPPLFFDIFFSQRMLVLIYKLSGKLATTYFRFLAHTAYLRQGSREREGDLDKT